MGVLLARCGIGVVAVATSAVLAACGGAIRDELRASVDAAAPPGDVARGDAGAPRGGGGGGGKPSAACPPLQVTADLNGVFAVAAADVWVVGSAGTVLHYDGCWRAEPKVTDVDLRAVWASADGTVWAGGAAATTLRRSGGTWSVFTTPGTTAVNGVWATTTAVWAAAGEGAIYRWDGAAWQLAHASTTPAAYAGIWAAGPDDVWVIGNGNEPDGDHASIRVHWNGAAWTESYTCNPEGNRFAGGGWIAAVRDIWGTGPDAVWVAGNCDPGASSIRDAFVERLRGGVWEDVSPPTALGADRELETIWASSETDVWTTSPAGLPDGSVIPTLLHFDGATWTASSDPATVGLLDIGGTSASDVWAVGRQGKRLHFDGTAWTPAPAATSRAASATAPGV